MAAIISEAEVTAAIEEALAEDFDSMQQSNAEKSEPKIERLKYSFEPKNKYVKEVKDMNEYVMSYFESLNHMSRRIITEQREVMNEYGNKWDQLSPEEQDKLLDDRILDPKVKKQYYVDSAFSTRKPDWFPVLRLAHGISSTENSFNPRDSIASVAVRFNVLCSLNGNFPCNISYKRVVNQYLHKVHYPSIILIHPRRTIPKKRLNFFLKLPFIGPFSFLAQHKIKLLVRNIVRI